MAQPISRRSLFITAIHYLFKSVPSWTGKGIFVCQSVLSGLKKVDNDSINA
jgi:hypothetical protein